MIILYGIVFSLIIFIYASVIRQPESSIPRTDNISSIAGGRVNEITTGAVQPVPMLDHLASVEEERKSQ